MATKRGERGPNIPKVITKDRGLVSRMEAAKILGCHPDTVKKMEKRNGGTLEIVRLHPKGRTVFFRLSQIRELATSESTNYEVQELNRPKVKSPKVHEILSAISELKKHPAVAAYIALRRAF